MVLRHLAAVFIFSGPLFYIGLLMAVDPAGIPTISQWLLRVFKTLVHRLAGLPSQDLVEPDDAEISRTVRRALRFAGVALLVFAIVA
jgi:hypothetical protein